ncbi:MAG: HAMP domain-containing histidine kinase [Deltaproteobacteria bacterium]|nr:HAMP domain-containing histidine kinase [Deltaproteobacteria bacterium]
MAEDKDTQRTIRSKTEEVRLESALPRYVELEQRIGWLIRLRWIAIVAVALTPDVVRVLTGIRVHRTPVLIVAGVMFLFNAGCSFCRKACMGEMSDPDARLRWARFLAVLQSVVDLAALTILLHMSGGLQNPFSTYFIFHVIISAILLRPKSCWMVTGGAAVMVVSEVLVHDSGIWPRTIPAGWTAMFGPPIGLKADFAIAFVLLSTMAVAAVLATSIMEQLRKRTAHIVELQRHLETKNESLASANRKLKRFGAIKDRFLGIATHDIKAPLAAVEGYLRALSDGTVDPGSDRGRQWIERSRQRLEGMRRLVTDLLDISRIESGKILSDKTRVNLLALAREACETFGVQAETSGLTLTLESPDEVPLVCGSQDRLRQVVDNLVSNALKFTEEGGVTIRLTPKDDMLEFQVEDTGIGIPQESLDHVFTDFYRVRTAKRREGAGLGLAIVYRLVEAHGGTISAASTLGKGTRFTVRLPLSEQVCVGTVDMVDAINDEPTSTDE